MAGIPDVTNKLEEKNAANKIIYQEVVFNYEPSMLFHFTPFKQIFLINL